MILGAVLAGGRSSRFGSDKALAMLGDQTLLDQAIAALRSQCDAVAVVGREEASAPCLPDWPAPDMGPLAGLAAALRHARAQGFDAVLSCSVDSFGLPADLIAQLSPAPRYLAEQPVIGLWPARASGDLEALLFNPNARHSMRAFAEAIGAHPVTLPTPIANINTPEDLAAHKGFPHGL